MIWNLHLPVHCISWFSFIFSPFPLPTFKHFLLPVHKALFLFCPSSVYWTTWNLPSGSSFWLGQICATPEFWLPGVQCAKYVHLIFLYDCVETEAERPFSSYPMVTWMGSGQCEPKPTPICVLVFYSMLGCN